MNVWEFIDMHPVLTVVLILLFMSCLPTVTYVRKSGGPKQ